MRVLSLPELRCIHCGNIYIIRHIDKEHNQIKFSHATDEEVIEVLICQDREKKFFRSFAELSVEIL